MKIRVKNHSYFERGTMSLTPKQKKALESNKKLTVVDKETGATYPVNNVLALQTIQHYETETGDVYYVARFK